MINIPDLYPDDAPVDQTAYCLLLIIDRADKKLWKRKLSREINDWRSSGRCPLNITDTVSLQTVCRRMNKLEKQGYVETTPVFTEDVDGYVEAYTLTEDGQTVLDDIHETVFSALAVEYVSRGMNSKDLVLQEGVMEKLAAYMTDELQADSPEQLQDVLAQHIGTVETGIRVTS